MVIQRTTFLQSSVKTASTKLCLIQHGLCGQLYFCSYVAVLK